MKHKYAQISIFALMGLVILIAFSIFFYIRSERISPEIEKAAEFPFEFAPVKNYVESCIENVGKDGIEFIGKRGGYFELPNYNYQDQFIKTAYYFYEDRSYFPKLEILQNSISGYINSELLFCLDGLKNITQTKNIDYKIEKIDTLIIEDSVIINAQIPTIYRLDDVTYENKQYRVSIDRNKLYDIYNFTEYIVSKQLEDKYSLCLSCIINRASSDNLFVDIENIENNTYIFTVMYNDTATGEFYEFIFTNKYLGISCENLPTDWPEDKLNDFVLNCLNARIEEYGYDLKIREIPNLIAIADFPFFYIVRAEGIDVNYTDSTNLFDINQTTGLIKFIPKEEDIGTHYVLIIAVDSLENEVAEIFQLNITKP